MRLREQWKVGSGWKVTVAATTVAAMGGVALASTNLGGSSLPPIDLQNPTVLEVSDDDRQGFEVVPNFTVPWDDLDSSFDSPFLSAADDSIDSPDDSIDSPDDSIDSPDDSIDSPDDSIDSPDDSA